MKGNPKVRCRFNPKKELYFSSDFILRPMNDLLTCIIGVTDECPKTAKFMEEMLMKMSEIQKQQGGPAMPSYAESKKYIMESCPSLPEGRSINFSNVR